MKHTPGPWEQVSTTMIFPADRDQDAQSIALVNVRREEWQANARLIARAPDLLAALVQAVDMLDGGFYDQEAHAAHAASFRALIAKARGEAT